MTRLGFAPSSQGHEPHMFLLHHRAYFFGFNYQQGIVAIK